MIELHIQKMNSLRAGGLSFRRIAEQLAKENITAKRGPYSGNRVRDLMIKHEKKNGPVHVEGTAALNVGAGYIRIFVSLTPQETNIAQRIVDCLRKASKHIARVEFVGVGALCDAVGVDLDQELFLMDVIQKIRGATWYSLTLGKGGGLWCHTVSTRVDGERVFKFVPASILRLDDPDEERPPKFDTKSRTPEENACFDFGGKAGRIYIRNEMEKAKEYAFQATNNAGWACDAFSPYLAFLRMTKNENHDEAEKASKVMFRAYCDLNRALEYFTERQA